MKRQRRRITACPCLLVLLLCGCGKAEAELTELERLLARPASPYAEHVFSHQGTAKEEIPESFAAYDLAVLYGSRFLEQDLVVSSDGVLYCCHDLSPARLTGETRLFSELSAQEIDALRVTDTGLPLLRLSEVFQRYGAAVIYVIELRQDAISLEPFIKLVEDWQMQDHIIVQSSSLELLRQLDGRWPEAPKLYLAFGKDSVDAVMDVDYVDIVAVSGGLFTQACCEQVHAAGKKYCVYVVNATSSIRKAIEMGADCYFTDFTGKAFALEELYRTKK